MPKNHEAAVSRAGGFWRIFGLTNSAKRGFPGHIGYSQTTLDAIS